MSSPAGSIKIILQSVTTTALKGYPSIVKINITLTGKATSYNSFGHTCNALPCFLTFISANGFARPVTYSRALF